MSKDPQSGAGSYGGGRGSDHPAREDISGPNTDQTLGNAAQGAEQPPAEEKPPLGWSVGPVAPVTSPAAEKEKGGG